jgi:hypothetical protein
VISTGVADLASYQAAGALPESVYVSQNTPGMLDEGSWMLELVHQHAPDAMLGFCDGLDLDFDGCIKGLAENFHTDVIVDDILFSGQFYPDTTADVVGQLEAGNERLVFIHLSGNEQQGGYWQGPVAAAVPAIAGAARKRGVQSFPRAESSARHGHTPRRQCLGSGLWIRPCRRLCSLAIRRPLKSGATESMSRF